MTTKRTPTRRRLPRGEVSVPGFPTQLETITCGFCEGRRRDPFGIMSYLSSCCVCRGKGTVSIRTPYVRCAFCQGTGVHPSSRLTCTACDGVGVAFVIEPSGKCPSCQGTGGVPGNAKSFWCLTCHGAGVVALKGGLVSVGGMD